MNQATMVWLPTTISKGFVKPSVEVSDCAVSIQGLAVFAECRLKECLLERATRLDLILQYDDACYPSLQNVTTRLKNAVF